MRWCSVLLCSRRSRFNPNSPLCWVEVAFVFERTTRLLVNCGCVINLLLVSCRSLAPFARQALRVVAVAAICWMSLCTRTWRDDAGVNSGGSNTLVAMFVVVSPSA